MAKRSTQQEPSERSPQTEIKETVLQNSWWKKTTDCTVDIRTELYKNENPATIYGDNHYDLINENEMDSTVLSKDGRVFSRKSPPLPKPTNDEKRKEYEVPFKYPAATYITSKEEEISKCLEICEMVNIFKPLIVQNLLVHDILPSLPFLENHDDIYQEMKMHSPKNAVVSLLDELERSKELGKWQKFIDALIDNGYTYIVDNIRGYRFISHGYQIEYIKSLTKKLGKMIVTRELLPHLLAKDLISDTDKENIQQEGKNHGNIAAVYLLLDRIHRKHRNWYILFIEALKEANMDDAAADLQIPELLKSKRTKVTDVYQGDDKVLYNVPPPKENNQKTGKEKSDETICESHTTKPFVHKRLLPPLPPVPAPVMTNYVEEQSDDDIVSGYETYDDETYDDVCNVRREKREKYGQTIKSPEAHVYAEENSSIENVSTFDSPNLKALKDELEKMKKHCEDLHFEIDLREQMSSLHDDVNTALRRVSKLKKNNAVKEQENQALQITDGTPEEDKDVNVDNTNTINETPTETEVDREYRGTTIKSLGFRKKQTFVFREPLLLENCKIGMISPVNVNPALSVVQLYSPTFESRSTINQMFEKVSCGTELDIVFKFN